MKKTSASVTRFFQLVMDRQFAEAERTLQNLREKMRRTEWNRGYLRALYGMLIARKNSDPYVFMSNINLNDKKVLKKYMREFLKHSKNGLHADYDRGFFSAWAEYMKALTKIKRKAENKDQ